MLFLYLFLTFMFPLMSSSTSRDAECICLHRLEDEQYAKVSRVPLSSIEDPNWKEIENAILETTLAPKLYSYP